MRSQLDKIWIWEFPDGNIAITYFHAEGIKYKITYPPNRQGKRKTLVASLGVIKKIVPKRIFDQSMLEPLETENEYIGREVARLKDIPRYAALTNRAGLKSELPDAAQKRKWRMRNGSIVIDNTVELPDAAKTRKINSIKQKLISAGLPLTDDEADYLLRARN